VTEGVVEDELMLKFVTVTALRGGTFELTMSWEHCPCGLMPLTGEQLVTTGGAPDERISLVFLHAHHSLCLLLCVSVCLCLCLSLMCNAIIKRAEGPHQM
jgi:hypothetical protein